MGSIHLKTAVHDPSLPEEFFSSRPTSNYFALKPSPRKLVYMDIRYLIHSTTSLSPARLRRRCQFYGIATTDYPPLFIVADADAVTPSIFLDDAEHNNNLTALEDSEDPILHAHVR
ncbi:hypothetical protein B0H16DRAFT_1722587 [Mycena metata]|uniref:Uncharacterized protein n=1 Tax=Mycena metata TaxID=1033252 RepID=A0AAD7J381_9AGAR|nr:hypothetical protein B0H16DRAFT_1722587 [Mycena metata]